MTTTQHEAAVKAATIRNSRTVARLDFAKVEAKIGSILGDDPVCNGRVTTSSIARIAALVVQAENYALSATPATSDQVAHDPDCGLLFEDGPDMCTCRGDGEEVARLREALEQIANGIVITLECGDTWPSPLGAKASQDIARAALGPETREGE